MTPDLQTIREITTAQLAELRRDADLDVSAWDLPGVRAALLVHVAWFEAKLALMEKQSAGLEAEIGRLLAIIESQGAEWRDEDQPLPEDAAIADAHPTRSGRHDLHAEAMQMVGARRSKAALVELVNWLLVERERRSP